MVSEGLNCIDWRGGGMAMEKTGEPEEAGEPAHDFFDVLEGIGKAIESGGPGSIPEGINRLALAQKGLAVEYGCARAIQSGKPEALLVLLGCAPKGSKRQALAAQALGWASSAGSINCMEATAMAEPSVLADEAACQGAAVAAAKKDRLDVVAWIASRFDGLDWRDSELSEAGCLAGDRGLKDQLASFLAAGMNPNGRGKDGGTPLARAVRSGRADLCGALLFAGADPLRGTVDKPCAMLLSAVASCGQARDEIWDMMEECLQAREPGGQGLDGDAVLALSQLSMQEGARAAKAVSLLLSKGVDPNDFDAQGRTALMSAAVASRQSPGSAMLAALMAAGADPSIKDAKGWDAARYARDTSARSGVAEWIEAEALRLATPVGNTEKAPLRM